jgi:hypothetical protein
MAKMQKNGVDLSSDIRVNITGTGIRNRNSLTWNSTAVIAAGAPQDTFQCLQWQNTAGNAYNLGGSSKITVQLFPILSNYII